MTAPELSERSQRFNDDTGAISWNYQSAATHPDACTCNVRDGTPHKHYSASPHACGRCRCEAYTPNTGAMAPSTGADSPLDTGNPYPGNPYPGLDVPALGLPSPAWEDAPLPEDAEINAAHPLKTGRHDLYAEAMRLVGAKRSKGALVELVNWLLSRAKAP